MLETLREKKAELKAQLPVIDGMGFRTINDVEGECATLLTLLFDTREQAEAVAAKLVADCGILGVAHLPPDGPDRGTQDLCRGLVTARTFPPGGRPTAYR